MKTLLKETTPKEAFKMFVLTFTKKELIKRLDDAFIHFTNYTSLLRTTCTETIAAFANQKCNEDILDVLAICHLCNQPTVLYGMLSDLRDSLQQHTNDLSRAKKQQEIMGDIFHNDLHYAYNETIKKHQQLYNSVKQDIYTVEAMLFLVNTFKK